MEGINGLAETATPRSAVQPDHALKDHTRIRYRKRSDQSVQLEFPTFYRTLTTKRWTQLHRRGPLEAQSQGGNFRRRKGALLTDLWVSERV